ncbi:MAG: M20/M25/M40 family metallo-hydrolase [Gammaproteobacteria bacterium]|nr:M20/M25/M40 family metallo-hydrolase [Gammaproteobacteria bacterium]
MRWLIAAGLVALSAGAVAEVPAAATAQALDVLQQSIRFRTFAGQGQVPAYAEYLAGVLRAGGFAAADITITPFEDTAVLTARYRGTNPALKPLVLAAHMDVVPALPSDWGRDPFTPVIENGFVFGRGSADNKFGIATMIATLVWLKSGDFAPARDIVLALTGDEETTQASTARLAQQLRHAELVLNSDAGGGLLSDDGQPLVYVLQAAEKTYADFAITFTSPGGHSSRPGPGNPVYALARALERLAAYHFPPQQSELTREYFRAVGALTPGDLGAAMRRYGDDSADAAAIERIRSDPEYVGQLGTTCVATMVQAGHAPNALPQRATATVNCRVFPGVSVESVQRTLSDVIADPTAQITVIGSPVTSDASPLRADFMAALRRAVDRRHPGLRIVPSMSPGATDSLYYRNLGVPSYGVSGLFMQPADDFAHGLNERIPVDSIEDALLLWHSLVGDLAR